MSPNPEFKAQFAAASPNKDQALVVVRQMGRAAAAASAAGLLQNPVPWAGWWTGGRAWLLVHMLGPSRRPRCAPGGVAAMPPSLINLLWLLPASQPRQGCASGRRSDAAIQLLKGEYSNLVNLQGGFAAWSAAGLPTV